MKHHTGRRESQIWRFTAPPPFGPRHRAAQAAMWGLISRREGLSVEDITAMERTAIQDARRFVAEALIKCGSVVVTTAGGQRVEVKVIDVFAALSGSEIDMIIGETWDALRASTMRQSIDEDAVPAPQKPADASKPATMPDPLESRDDHQAASAEVPAAPPGYFRNPAGHLLKKGSLDDPLPELAP